MAGLPVPLLVLVSAVPRLRTADGAQRASACSRPWGTGTDTGVEGARAGPSPAGHTQTRERPLTATRCRLNSRRAASWSRLGGKRDWVPESSSSVTSLCRRHRGTLSRVRRTWSHGATYRCPKQQAPLLTPPPPPSFLGTVQGQAASRAPGRALQPRRRAPRCPSLTERVPGVADMQRARGRPKGGSVGLSVDVIDSGARHRARHDGHAGRPLCAGPCSGRRLVGITSRPDPRLT